MRPQNLVLPAVLGLSLGAFLSLRAEPAAPAPPQVRFFVPETRGTLGETQIIPFEADPSKDRRIFPAVAEPADALEVLQPPTVLDNEKIGYVRVRALKDGPVTLRVAEVPLRLNIGKPAKPIANGVPVIVTPVSGSYAWGKIGIGVELPIDFPEPTNVRMSLRLPDGSELSPVLRERSGANWTFAFQIDTDALPPGSSQITAVVRSSAGEEKSEPLTIESVKVDPAKLIAGQCADHMSKKRPERFNEKEPKVETTNSAPGGSYVENNGAYPPLCLSVDVKEPGYYQMILHARGDPAAGIFPSIGVFVDERDRPSTVGRIPDTDWQRSPIGLPVYLTSGTHVITPLFMNDFGGPNGVDRNLHEARFEFARIIPKRAVVADAGSPSMMMQGAPQMQMQAAAPQMMEGGGNMMMMSGASATVDNGAVLSPTGSMRVAFRRIFDGETISGPVVIRGVAWGPNLKTNAPRVELRVNGKPIMSEQFVDQYFSVPLAAFHQGENTFQLCATEANGATVLSPVQKLILDGKAQEGAIPRRFRFSTLDPAWDPSLRERLQDNDGWAAQFSTNGEATLKLPNDLSGKFHAYIDGKGSDLKGPAVAELVLRRDGQPDTIISQNEFGGGNRTSDAGEVNLEPGPKSLVVRFVNDLYEAPDKEKNIPGGDRNFWLHRLSLNEVLANIPEAPAPEVAMLYPAAGARISGSDAVVAKFFSGVDCKSVDLVIDGKAQDLQIKPRDGIGPVVLPLLARDLTPGWHKLRVVAQDNAGKKCETAEISFEVSSAPVVGPYQRAIRLLDRFAYGAEPEELAQILTLGEKKWLSRKLDDNRDAPAEAATFALQAATFPDDGNEGLAPHRAIHEILSTSNPVRARFLLWTENHFSTWIQKVGGRNQWAQHIAFSKEGAAPFSELLRVSATSPAMLIYLDQNRSFSNQLNENYAREIMELHTLGVNGGYSQTDVTTLAKHLNGWTVADESDIAGLAPQMQGSFRFEPRLSEGRTRRIFGMEFQPTLPEERYEGVVQALEMLAAHPSTARFISEKLAEHYVSDPAPPKLVKDLSRVYMQTNGDMKAMLMAIAEHPDFWSAPPRVATPQDFSFRFSRLCNATNTGAVNDFLNRSGMGLFDRATPDGYPEMDSNYVNSNILLQRWRFSETCQGQLIQMIPRAWINQDPAKVTNADAQRMIDLVAVRMTGRALSDDSNAAALKFFDEARKKDNDCARVITTFVAQTPELSLR